MTEEEKELNEKMKQFQYEQEERKKKMETLENDVKKKGNKKTFIFKMNRTIGRIVIVWASIGFIVIFGLLFLALANFMNALNSFDAVQHIEAKYNMSLKTISREAGDKIITYKVKPQKWKYRKIEFTIVRVGMEQNLDDFDDRYLKYIIENIKQKELLEGFEIKENYNEYNLLEYELIYNLQGDEEEANKKIEDLKNYLLKHDKNIEKIINLNEKIKKATSEEKSSLNYCLKNILRNSKI